MACEKGNFFMSKAGKLSRPLTPLLGLLLMYSNQLYSQVPVVDTFEVKIARQKTDSAKLEKSNAIAKYFENIDSVTAWKYFKISQGLAKKINSKFSKISILELEGVLVTKSNQVKAYGLYEQAIDLCRQDTAKSL